MTLIWAVKSAKKKAAKAVPTEHAEQVAFVKWFRYRFPLVMIFAIPNGGQRHIVAAKKLQDEGVVAGVPDLYIPEWRLWVEMKRSKGGVLSIQQEYWRDYLKEMCGDNWLLAKGAEHGKELLLKFFESIKKQERTKWIN